MYATGQYFRAPGSFLKRVFGRGGQSPPRPKTLFKVWPARALLAGGNTSDVPIALGEPQIPIGSRCDIGWQTAARGYWRQGNRAGRGNAPDGGCACGQIVVVKPEIAVRSRCDPAQVEIIIRTRAGEREQGNCAGRSDAPDLGTLVRVVEGKPEIAVGPCGNVVSRGVASGDCGCRLLLYTLILNLVKKRAFLPDLKLMCIIIAPTLKCLL